MSENNQNDNITVLEIEKLFKLFKPEYIDQIKEVFTIDNPLVVIESAVASLYMLSGFKLNGNHLIVTKLSKEGKCEEEPKGVNFQSVVDKIKNEYKNIDIELSKKNFNVENK